MVLRVVAVGLASLLAVGCVRSRPIVAPTVVFVEGVSGVTAVTSDEVPDSSPSWKSNDEVEVEWRGSWWPAVILERRSDRWLVHYEGYGSDWDEVVGADRIRERRAELEIERTEEPSPEPDP